MQSGANSILLLSVNDIASMPAGTDHYTDCFSIIYAHMQIVQILQKSN